MQKYIRDATTQEKINELNRKVSVTTVDDNDRYEKELATHVLKLEKNCYRTRPKNEQYYMQRWLSKIVKLIQQSTGIFYTRYNL